MVAKGLADAERSMLCVVLRHCLDDNQTVYIIVVLVLGLAIGLFAARNQIAAKEYGQVLPDEDWHLACCTFNNLNAEIEDDVLKITYYGRKASGELTIVNSKGEELHYSIGVKDGELIVNHIDN